MRRFALTVTMVVALGAFARGQGAEPMARAQLVLERDVVAPGEAFDVGLRIAMQPGVHTYWRNPGDSGLPTRIEWRLPPGFRAEPLRWPYPRRFDTDGFVSYGYSRQVLLLARIQAPASLRPGMAVRLAAHAEWLACKEECVPESADLSVIVRVRAKKGNPTQWAAAFEQARREIPSGGEGWTFALSDGERGAVVLRIEAPEGVALRGRKPHFYPYEGGVIEPGGEQKATFDGERSASLRLPVSSFHVGSVRSLAGVLVVGDGEAARAIEVAVGETDKVKGD